RDQTRGCVARLRRALHQRVLALTIRRVRKGACPDSKSSVGAAAPLPTNRIAARRAKTLGNAVLAAPVFDAPLPTYEFVTRFAGAHRRALRTRCSGWRSIQSAIALAIAMLFFSSIIIWPLPWMPTSGRRSSVFLTPAWVR